MTKISRFLSDTSANASVCILYLYKRMSARRCKISFCVMGRIEQENRKKKVGGRDYSEGLVPPYFDVSFYIVKLVFNSLFQTVVFDKCNIQILPCTLPLQFLKYCYFPKSTDQTIKNIFW